MLYSPHGRPGNLVGLTLACLLAASALPPPAAPARAAAPVAAPAGFLPPGDMYRQTNLVSNQAGVAAVRDPQLGVPWSISTHPAHGVAVANLGTGVATLYRRDVCAARFVKEISPAAISLGAPASGVVVNYTNDFVIGTGAARGPARYIFTTNTGKIMAWRPNVPTPGSTTAVVVVDNPGLSYGTPTIAFNPFQDGPGNFLYVTGGFDSGIKAFDAAFRPSPIGDRMNDPRLPDGLSPSNIQNFGGVLYVAYGGSEEGAGKGAVRAFAPDGTLRTLRIEGGLLTRPLGLALAPSNFGAFSNALLVGNFGLDGPSINAYDPDAGTFLGSLKNEAGADINLDRLVHLAFGSGGGGGDPNTLYFTSENFQGRSLLGSLKPAAPASLFLFQTPQFSVAEGRGHLDVTVLRGGDAAGAATVNYTTCDRAAGDRATQKTDYEVATGKLTFGPGETTKTFRVLVVDDRFVERTEELGLGLSNPSGASVDLHSQSSSAGLRISDNDLTPPSANPIDEAQFFVRQHYLDFLNREPDAAGLNFWTNQLTSCGSDAQCLSVRRENVSAAFFLSIEFQRTGLLAYLTHRAAYGSRPPYDEFMRWTQALQKNYSFGAPGAEAQLEANRQAFFRDFVAEPAFEARYTPLLPAGLFADLLFGSAGITPTPQQRQAVIDEFGTFGEFALTHDRAARARALRRVAEHPTLAEREFAPAFVQMEYFGYLRRDPDEPGFNFWLRKLNANGGNFSRAEMVKAFILSIEYRRRFGP